MTRRQTVLVAGAAVCIAAAVIFALAARDVGRQQAALRSGDVALADANAGRDVSWHADQAAPFGLSGHLLGIGDDLEFRRAVAHFHRAYRRIPSFDQSLEGTALRVQAETSLAREIRIDDNHRRSSVAANLLGILAFVDATTADNSSTPVERSIFEFQDAIHLDPGNDEAKANLELVFQRQSVPNTLKGRQRHTRTSESGASAASEGHGY